MSGKNDELVRKTLNLKCSVLVKNSFLIYPYAMHINCQVVERKSDGWKQGMIIYHINCAVTV
jgi:hypothetical protein